jgi:hypothetical protein
MRRGVLCASVRMLARVGGRHVHGPVGLDREEGVVGAW